MPGRVRLRPILTRWPDLTEVLKDWRQAIERALSWSWGEGFDVQDVEGGKLVLYRPPPSAVSAVAATGGITAAPDANTLGQGNATLRVRRGAALVNGPTIHVYSNFSTAIPAGTRIEVSPDGADYKLVGSDCVS